MIVRILAFLVAFVCLCTPAFAIDFTFAGVTRQECSEIDYYQLTSVKSEWYGHYRECKYSFSDKLPARERGGQLQAQVLETLPGAATGFDKWGILTFQVDGVDYVLKLEGYGTSATLKLLTIGPYTPFVSFASGSWPLNSKLAKKGTDAPPMPLTPVLEGAAIERLSYKNYDEQLFRAGKEKFTGKGRFWDINYRLDSYTKTNDLRFRGLHNYRDLLVERGAVIHPNGDNSFVFELSADGKNYLGRVDSYNSTFSLKVIEEEGFEQTLVLSPDKLKAELDAKGKVTLDGIYFDTDKATLKPESAAAVTSAASLLRHYPDLVLEIQGHTDDQGDDAYNRELSARRARAVVAALVQAGADEAQLKARGFGEDQPVADNGTAEGRALNRRVELHRLSGGDAIHLIDIDFIKPLPRAEVDARRDYPAVDFVVRHTPPFSEKKGIDKMTGYAAVIYKYVIFAEGKRDRSFSRLEIIKNYKAILPLTGAEIQGEDGNSLYFSYADRGDGTPAYGIIKAYEGEYEVCFYTRAQ